MTEFRTLTLRDDPSSQSSVFNKCFSELDPHTPAQTNRFSSRTTLALVLRQPPLRHRMPTVLQCFTLLPNQGLECRMLLRILKAPDPHGNQPLANVLSPLAGNTILSPGGSEHRKTVSVGGSHSPGQMRCNGVSQEDGDSSFFTPQPFPMAGRRTAPTILNTASTVPELPLWSSNPPSNRQFRKLIGRS